MWKFMCRSVASILPSAISEHPLYCINIFNRALHPFFRFLFNDYRERNARKKSWFPSFDDKGLEADADDPQFINIFGVLVCQKTQISMSHQRLFSFYDFVLIDPMFKRSFVLFVWMLLLDCCGILWSFYGKKLSGLNFG